VVAVAWVGFDQPHKLGNGETGGAAALPMWINYMRKALDGVPESYPTAPAGLIRIKPAGSPTDEMIYQENLPTVPPEAPNEPTSPPAEEAPAASPAAAAPPPTTG
jgi:penicillin-binding protein 1A